MKKIWLMLFLIITAIVAYGQDGSKNFIDKNYIEVIGHAEKQITPDEIYLKILINEKDIKGQSLASIEKLMIEKFKEMGIDISKQLEIKDFSSNFKNYWII
ncbi:MAG: SIMPL domain-containing protein, partial [Bacteroidales bacterium]